MSDQGKVPPDHPQAGTAAGAKKPSFWATFPGVLTAVAGLVSAGTGLLVALNQVGVLGSDEDEGTPGAVVAPSESTSVSASSAPSETVDPAAGAGDVLAGTWRGVAAGPGGADEFEVVLEIEAPCRLRETCGVISVSSAPCIGRVKLWSVRSQTYELYVDRFTADSSPDCTPGAGDFVELLGDGTLRYSTNYSDAVGVLTRA